MLRSESQLKNQLGEPATRYNVGSEEIWRWQCSCLAVRLGNDSLQWSPCEHHRPDDWPGFPEDR
jgi:hypothetical protein